MQQGLQSDKRCNATYTTSATSVTNPSGAEHNERSASRRAGGILWLDAGCLRLLHCGVPLRCVVETVRRQQRADCADHLRDAGDASCGRGFVWFAGGSLWTARSADVQRDLFFADRIALRICAEFYGVFYFAGAVWHWHGRRVGRGRVTGYGSGAAQMARRAERHSAEWIFRGVFAGGNGHTVSAAAVGLARHVLDWRGAGIAGAVHPDEGAGIAGVERAQGGDDRRRVARGGEELEALRLSCGADDVHDVPFARYAGLVSGLSARSAWRGASHAREHGDHLQLWRGDWRDYFWAVFAARWAAQEHDGGAGGGAAGDSAVGVQRAAGAAGGWSVPDAGWGAGRMGRDSGTSERVGGGLGARVDAGIGVSVGDLVCFADQLHRVCLARSCGVPVGDRGV